MPKLLLMDAAGNVQQIPLDPGSTTTLGRGSDCAVRIDSRCASRAHAVVEIGTQGVYITDLHSLNGTLVNGELIDRHLLAHGDAIEIGSVELRYVALERVLSEDEALLLLTAPQLRVELDEVDATMPDQPHEWQRRRR